MKWPRKKFSDLYAVPSRNGLNRPSRVRGAGYKMVNMGELFANDRIGNIPMDRVPLNEKEIIDCTLVEGDLLFARQSLVLEGAGKCSYILDASETTTFESHLIRVRLDKAKAVPLFYYYLFSSPYSGISTIVQQCAQAGIRGSELGNLEVLYPEPDKQYEIAKVLGTYDDAIENNRRRMALLEESARLLYEEWFVRLRFPGHEHTPISHGIPQGWERHRIGDVAECVGGGTPSTKVSNYWDDGDISWVTPTDVTRNDHFVLLDSQKRITEAGLQNSSAKVVPPHAVLMTSRASVGFFAVAGREVCTNQGFISVVPHDAIFSNFILFQLSHRVEEIRGMASGSTFPEVSRGKFREFLIQVPPRRIVADFDEQASMFLKQIRILKLQNQKLRAARDLLLPRLMSGEIEVVD